MSSVTFTWTGLQELKAALRQLPAELAGEAANLVEAAANGAAVDIKAAYPTRTKKLRDGVQVEHQRSRFGAKSVVKNTSKYALSFEAGTQARHTKIGANRGAMPPGNVFYPRIRKARRKMNSDLKDMVERKGLLVTGDAE